MSSKCSSSLSLRQVEDCLFRLPSDTLVSQSDVFRDLLLLPVEADETEGQSNTNPIVLEHIKKGRLPIPHEIVISPVSNQPEWLDGAQRTTYTIVTYSLTLSLRQAHHSFRVARWISNDA